MRAGSRIAFWTFVSLAMSGCAGESHPGPKQNPPARDYSAYQVYWDGKTDETVPDSGCLRFLADHYAGPELMAIGDSLFNGVQSLRINWWLSEWSAPTLVAIRMGLVDEYAADRKGPRRFHGPQYPTYEASAAQTQDFGFNLEDLSVPGGFIATPRRQAPVLLELARDWRPPNRRAMVDNLAFAGATSDDLLTGTVGRYRTAAEVVLPRLARSSILNGFSQLADAFFNVNAAFVLNPMHVPCLDGMTPLQQVELRKPRRLLVNIGANDGLWQVALTAKPVSDPALAKSIGPDYRDHVRRIIDTVAGITGIEHVYVNGLVLPSQTANMVPTPGGQAWNPDLLKGAGGLSQAQLDEADRVVAEGNRLISDYIGETNRGRKAGYPSFAFVDLAATLERYDYKRCHITQGDCQDRRYKVDALTYGMPFTQYFDNEPLRFDGPSGVETGAEMHRKLLQGGLMSFDNMHLSSVGYGIMAHAVTEEIGRSENGLPNVDNARCKGNPKEPGYADMRHGDCVELLTTPGYAFSDRTQRNFVFDRLGGAKETRDQSFFRGLAGFLYAWIK